MAKNSKRLSPACIKRLQADLASIVKNPVQYITTRPLEDNLLEWHFVIHSITDPEVFRGGYYEGMIIFSPQYPFKPPAIQMITPQGRFRVNQKLCLSMTDFHQESWSPLWSVHTILEGFLSFMLDGDSQTFGSILSTAAEKRKLAKKSIEFNLNRESFCQLFPEIAEKMKKELKQQKEVQQQAQTTTRESQIKKFNSSTNTWWTGLSQALMIIFVGIVIVYFSL